MPATLLATKRVEKPWGRHHLFPGFPDPAPGDEPIGEVYVVGVRPDHQGRGLAGPLTRLGLAHLAGLGLGEVELYVEGDNAPALATYGRAGFERKALHVMYSREVHPPMAG